MGRASSIPLGLQAEVVARHIKKQGSDEIAAWLGEQGHPITDRSVRRFIARRMKEHSSSVQAQMGKQLEAVAGTGLEALPQLMQRAVLAEKRADDLYELAVIAAESENEESVGGDELNEPDPEEQARRRRSKARGVDYLTAISALAEGRKQRAEQRALVDLALHYSGADPKNAAPQTLADLLGNILERHSRGEASGEVAGPSGPVLQ